MRKRKRRYGHIYKYLCCVWEPIVRQNLIADLGTHENSNQEK